MLYAPIPKDQWGGLGMEWDKTQSMFSYLDSMRYVFDVFYQLIFESSMFGVPPNYRCVLVRWSEIRAPAGRKRETMIESSDPKQVEAVLLMLISIAEEEKRARGR